MPINYYDWKSSSQTCPSCGWSGLGSKATVGETFAEGAEYHCPACEHRFGFLSYPLLEEHASDPRAHALDRALAEAALRTANTEQAMSPKELEEHLEYIDGVLLGHAIALKALLAQQPLAATQLRSYVSHAQTQNLFADLPAVKRQSVIRTLLGLIARTESST